MAPANQQQARGVLLAEALPQACDIRLDQRMQQADALAGGTQDARQPPWHQRAEIDAMLGALQPCQREPVAAREALAMGAGAQHHVEQPFRSALISRQ